MTTFSNDSMTLMVSNVESDLSNRFDAMINNSQFKKIRKEFKYCMCHPNFKKQVNDVIVNNCQKNKFQNILLVNFNFNTNTKLRLIMKLMMRLMMQLLMNLMRARKDFLNY